MNVIARKLPRMRSIHSSRNAKYELGIGRHNTYTALALEWIWIKQELELSMLPKGYSFQQHTDFTGTHKLSVRVMVLCMFLCVTHSKQLSQEENQAVFGKCAHVNGHGHNYTGITTTALSMCI